VRHERYSSLRCVDSGRGGRGGCHGWGASDDPGNGLGTRVVERVDTWYKHRVRIGLLDERGRRREESRRERARGQVCRGGEETLPMCARATTRVVGIGITQWDREERETYQVSTLPHSSFTPETSAWHRSHSASQSRRRSIVAPWRFVPFSASSSSSVKSSGVLSLSGEGSVSRYGE